MVAISLPCSGGSMADWHVLIKILLRVFEECQDIEFAADDNLELRQPAVGTITHP